MEDGGSRQRLLRVGRSFWGAGERVCQLAGLEQDALHGRHQLLENGLVRAFGWSVDGKLLLEKLDVGLLQIMASPAMTGGVDAEEALVGGTPAHLGAIKDLSAHRAAPALSREREISMAWCGCVPGGSYRAKGQPGQRGPIDVDVDAD